MTGILNPSPHLHVPMLRVNRVIILQNTRQQLGKTGVVYLIIGGMQEVLIKLCGFWEVLSNRDAGTPCFP